MAEYWPAWKDILPPEDIKWTPCVRSTEGIRNWDDALELLIEEIRNDARSEHTHPLKLAIALAVVDNDFVPGQIITLSDYEYTILEESP